MLTATTLRIVHSKVVVLSYFCAHFKRKFASYTFNVCIQKVPRDVHNRKWLKGLKAHDRRPIDVKKRKIFWNIGLSVGKSTWLYKHLLSKHINFHHILLSNEPKESSVSHLSSRENLFNIEFFWKKVKYLFVTETFPALLKTNKYFKRICLWIQPESL